MGGRNEGLEAIQLILSVPGAPVVAFLAIDSRIVVASIEQSLARLAVFSGWEYWTKFQMPFSLPPPPPKLKRLVNCLDAKEPTLRDLGALSISCDDKADPRVRKMSHFQ